MEESKSDMKKFNKDKYKKQIQKKYGIYRVGKQGRPGSRVIKFSSDKEFIKFCKKYDLIGYKGMKEPFSKKEWLVKPKKNKSSNYDLDKDGVPNHKDCNPYDPTKQDFGKGYIKPRTYRGYNVKDYYFSGGEYHLLPSAEEEEKKGLFSRLFK